MDKDYSQNHYDDDKQNKSPIEQDLIYIFTQSQINWLVWMWLIVFLEIKHREHCKVCDGNYEIEGY